jgi:tetratricopeptide (TPR) repeat protein
VGSETPGIGHTARLPEVTPPSRVGRIRMTSSGRYVGVVGALAVVVLVLPSLLWAHTLGALAWGWAPVVVSVLFLAGRRELAAAVPLVALGASTTEFLDAAPWPVPAVQLPDLRMVCVGLHFAIIAWVTWRHVSGRSYAVTAAGVMVALMSFHGTFTEGAEPRQILTSLRHALAMWSLLWLAARHTPRLRGVLRPAGLLVVLASVTLVWALHQGPTVHQLLLWLDALALFLLLSHGGRLEGWRRLAGLGLGVGAGVAALGLARVVLWWVAFGGWAAFGYRLKAGGLHENLVASMLAAAAPLMVTRLWTGRRALLWFVLPAWTVALLLTSSRGGWTAAVAGLALTSFLRKQSRRWLVPFAVCFLVALATLLSPAGQTARRRLVNAAEGLRGRREAWAATARMVLQRPLRGHGWDAGYARARYATSLASSKYLLSHAHNLPLELAYSYGIIGVALTAWIWTGGLRGVRRRGTWAAAGAGTTTAVVIHGLVAQPLVCPGVAALFLVGMSLACGDTIRWRASRSSPAALPAWLVLLWVGSAVPIITAAPATSATCARRLAPLETEPWQQESTRLRVAGRPGEAVAWLEQALLRKKEFPPLLTELGWTLWDAGRAADAARAMQAAHRLDPQGLHGGEHLTDLGYLLLHQGRETEARRVLEDAVRREPYGFREHPWVTSRRAGGQVEACLPGPEARPSTLAAWEQGSGACPGVSARQLVDGTSPRERDDFLWLGSALHCLRRLDEAAVVLEDGLDAWPDDGALSFRLAEVYRDAKRYREEAELCQQNGLLYREAEARLALGQWDAVLDAVARDLGRREYRLANDFWMRAQALWRLGRRDAGLLWASKSLYCLFRPERGLQIADWAATDCRPGESCHTYRVVLKHLIRERTRRWGGWDWRCVDHLSRLGSALGRAPAVDVCPVRGSSLIELVARARAATGNEAVRLATLAVRKAPEEPWLWLNLADAQAHAGDTGGALRSLGAAGRVGADRTHLLEREGRFLLTGGHGSDALAAYGEGAALEQGNGRWLVRMSDVLSELGFERAAAAALSGAGSREKDWADPHILLAERWAEHGRKREAEVEYLRAVYADPYSSWARDSYGRNLLNWSRPHDALAQLEVAASLEPLAPKPPYGMAQAYLALGDTAAAAEHLERAVSLDASFEPAAHLLREVRGG